MGSGSSKKKYEVPASFYGGIFVKLDKGTFVSGEVLQGQICLDLKDVYPGTKLLLSFKCHEYATWLDPIDDEHRHEPIKKEQKLKTFKQEQEVYRWSDGPTIVPGQYIFPFQFLIPARLPGSFFFSQVENRVTAEIRYTLTAYLKPDNEDKIAKLKHKTIVVLREMPQLGIEAQQRSLNKKEISCCCGCYCCACGTFSMKTTLDKNAYAPSEEVQLVSEIDNTHCKIVIEKVYVTLLQRISLQVGSYFKRVEIPTAITHFGKIKPGEHFLGSLAKRIALQLPPSQEEYGKSDVKPKKNPYPNFTPVPYISPSTNGIIVKSEFMIQVLGDTGCFSTLPQSELPIFIYAPMMQGMPVPVPPSNWVPKQLEPVNLTFSADKYLGHNTSVIVNNQVYQGPMAQV